MEIDPDELSDRDRHKILIGSVTPRPVAFVSTISPVGRTNLAPFSFFNAAGSSPIMLLFSPGTRDVGGGEKDTLRNARPPSEGGVGEFVVNVAVEAYAREVSVAAEPLPYGESEIELAGLTAAPSRVVQPPRIAESPVSFECRTTHVIEMAPGQENENWLVIGRVVHVYVRDDIIDERFRIDADKLATIGRMGGPEYCRTRERFALPRGPAAFDAPLPFQTAKERGGR